MTSREPDSRAASLGIAQYLARLGDRVRAARARRGMSRKILARDSRVSERYLAQLESGRGNPSIAVLHQIAGAMDMPVTDLADPRGGSDPAMAGILALLSPLDAEELAEAGRLLGERFAGRGAKGRRIALIGLRGAGKTTLGRELARILEMPFVELNRVIEQDYGAGIGELLSLSGQPAFRRYENRCLTRVLNAHDGAVISTGGGIVATPETYNMLLRRTHAIWLRASPEEHMRRVVAQGDMRPMEQNRDEAMHDLRAILEARTPLYGRAGAMIDTSGETVGASLEKLGAAARELLA